MKKLFWFSISSCLNTVLTMSCGVDKSPVQHVYEGLARIETYPWLGFLYYPYTYKKRFTTAVVLVTKQIALATASEIDAMPKHEFRDRARVVLGYNCSAPGIGIRDYAYHPDFAKDTFSTLAMIQLETDHVKIELRPICRPPSHFNNQQFFAMVLSDNCLYSRVRIYKMQYVSPEDCKTYYRRTGLDIDSMWPSHTACARSVKGGHCVWRSGAILVVKIGNRWRLLGFGVYGPGCQAPARFLDYGMYHSWVRRSVEKIGHPTVSTLAENHIVLRRSMSKVQRFGPCDIDETKRELYSDYTVVESWRGKMIYNISIYAAVEYSCVVIRADELSKVVDATPKIRLRRWCSSSEVTCSNFQFIDIHFYVEVVFDMQMRFSVKAYGREAKSINPRKAYKYLNYLSVPPDIQSFETELRLYLPYLNNETVYPWYRPP